MCHMSFFSFSSSRFTHLFKIKLKKNNKNPTYEGANSKYGMQKKELTYSIITFLLLLLLLLLLAKILALSRLCVRIF